MNIAEMFSESSRVVRQSTRSRIFSDHRAPSVQLTFAFALTSLLLWGADYGLDAESAKKTLIFRGLITALLLLSALVKWWSESILANCLATYLSLAAGEALTVALEAKLTGGMAAGAGQLLFFFLGAALLTPHFSTKWVVPGTLALMVVPHLTGALAGSGFPHLYYAAVVWPASVVAVLIHWKIRPVMVESVRLRLEAESAVLFDPVTSLLNKRGLEHSFGRLVKMGETKPLQQFLLLIEIDGLDRIKQSHGEDSARSIMAQMGETIELPFRGRDITASLGEEFACILQHLSREKAFDIGERFRLGVESKLFDCPGAPGGKLGCTVSIGIIFADTKEPIGSLVNLARVGISQARSLGGNHCVCI